MAKLCRHGVALTVLLSLVMVTLAGEVQQTDESTLLTDKQTAVPRPAFRRLLFDPIEEIENAIEDITGVSSNSTIDGEQPAAEQWQDWYTWAIIGACVIGGGLLLILLFWCCGCCCCAASLCCCR